jgi:hypothetical protein
METWTWRHEDGDMITWRHRHRDIETGRNGDVETGRHRHGDMNMETWTLRHKDIKWKMENGSQAFFLICLLFAHGANGSRLSVC